MPTMHNNGQEYIVNGKSERRTVEKTDFKGDLNMPTMHNKGQENVMTFDLHVVQNALKHILNLYLSIE